MRDCESPSANTQALISLCSLELDAGFDFALRIRPALFSALDDGEDVTELIVGATSISYNVTKGSGADVPQIPFRLH